MVAVTIALVVHRRALAAYFGLDDQVIMEEVRGLRPPVTGPWRFLSRALFFGLAVPRFGSDPFPYHAILWLLHAGNVALLFALVRRWSGSRLAALAAAVLFGASRLHAPALETPARIGEPLALALALAALLLSDGRGARRLLAAAAFALAMLAKESVAFLALALLVPRAGVPRVADRLRRAAPLLGAALAVGIALVLSRADAAHLAGEAYERAFGGNLFLNLMTYTRWAVDLTSVLPGMVSAIAAGAWPLGVAVTAGLVALVVAARGRSDLAALGAAWWLLALVPVLPLVHHTYLYYLYVPLAGLAIAAAGALDTASSFLTASPASSRTRAAARAISLTTLALLAVYVFAADRLLAERLARTLPGTGIPLDPDLRKSEMARQAVGAVGARLAGAHGSVAFFLPSELSQAYSTSTGRLSESAMNDSVGYFMLSGALDRGRGVRALLPLVDSVAFLPAWRPGYGSFELFSQGPDGVVFPLGRGPDGFATAGAALRRGGAIAPALRLLAGASGEFPEAARLRYEYAHALEVSGDSLGSRRELLELMRRDPGDTLAVRVRRDFERTRLH
jgi:hypothetical protein